MRADIGDQLVPSGTQPALECRPDNEVTARTLLSREVEVAGFVRIYVDVPHGFGTEWALCPTLRARTPAQRLNADERT
jgi:hypothetical protein